MIYFWYLFIKVYCVHMSQVYHHHHYHRTVTPDITSAFINDNLLRGSMLPYPAPPLLISCLCHSITSL